MTQKPAPNPKVLHIHPYVPGEAGDGGGRIIKLASNESALGPSPKVREAIEVELGCLARYPDGSSTLLRQKIGEVYGLDHKHIVCGNGSEQLIAYLAQIYAGPGDQVIQSEFGFIAYKIATLAAGADLVAARERDYTTDVDAILAAVTEKTKIVFLANPNNPTGTWIPASEMGRLRDKLPAHILLVLDAAYADYAGEKEYQAGTELVDAAIATGAENVCMLRTFSKIYGLAALRIGWCYGPESVIDALNRVRGAFNLSTLAQAAAIAALDDQDYMEKVRRLNNEQLPRVASGLKKLGLGVLPSAGNFVLAKFPGGVHQARRVFTDLKKHGIILRPVEGYRLAEFLRITIGTAEENGLLLKALGKHFK
ncbi:MAG: histidinol-phosphate transaminase [Proteobacteria bacterium]|nr:histidinol-phosphate transaminase [Pseudomonadota bacterium]